MIGVRLHEAQLAAIDAWASWQEPQPTRPEAIRGLVEIALSLPRFAGLKAKAAKSKATKD